MYLDNASTTPLNKEVKDYIISILDEYGNPSSHYSLGDRTKQIISKARNNVAKFINGKSENIIFTSGGSASNTLAIRGYVQNIIVLCFTILLRTSQLLNALNLLKMLIH